MNNNYWWDIDKQHTLIWKHPSCSTAKKFKTHFHRKVVIMDDKKVWEGALFVHFTLWLVTTTVSYCDYWIKNQIQKLGDSASGQCSTSCDQQNNPLSLKSLKTKIIFSYWITAPTLLQAVFIILKKNPDSIERRSKENISVQLKR